MDSDSPLTWEKLEIKKTNYLLNIIIILLLILIIFLVIHHMTITEVLIGQYGRKKGLKN